MAKQPSIKVTSGLPGKGKTSDFAADGVKAAIDTKPIAVDGVAGTVTAVKTIQVTPNDGGHLTVADELPGTLTLIEHADFDNGDPTGLENVTVADILVPRLTILQALSPQLNRQKPEYIEGAQQGQICDVGTGEVWDSILVVPCYYARVFLEWAPRSTQKGLVHNHGMDATVLEQCVQDDKKRYVLNNGNYIAETATFYCLNISAEGRRSFIPMASTQLQSARRWLTLATGERLTRGDGSKFQPPLFYRSWQASTVMTSNAEGSWYIWKFDPGPEILALDPRKNLLLDAKGFCIDAATGLVKGDLTEDDLIPRAPEADSRGDPRDDRDYRGRM